MKLLLTSNGITAPELDGAFAELTGGRKGLKVAIIPTASDPIEWVPEKEGDQAKDYVARLIPEKKEKNAEWLNSYKEAWEKKGYTVVIADLKADPTELKKKIESVDIIDVTGGDVNYLLDWAKRSKFDSYLKDVLHKGVVYVGTSAGSGLINPDIGLTWWKPDEALDHVGLGIVDFIIVPHQKENEERSNAENLTKRKKYLQSIIKFPWKVYWLQDGQAIKVVGDKIEHIGPGTKKSL